MREPIDTDQHIPHPLKRESAERRLLELLPPDLADHVWDELIAPLYDVQQMALNWRRGRCRHCGAAHPDNPPMAVGARDGHVMACPLYVGPLQHQSTGGGHTFTGWHEKCSCGKSYPNHAGADLPIRCPDADEDWRGPRPEGHWEEPVLISEGDVRVDVFSNSAGCHVRVTHAPTSLVVTVDGTSIGQIRAREQALAELEQKINDKQQEQPHV